MWNHRPLLLFGLLGILLTASSTLVAQVTLTVRITSGSSTTTCTDGFFGGAPEPHWRVEIDGQGYTTYPRRGLCFNDAPNTQYSEVFNCTNRYPATLPICLRAFEDDGTACIVNESCLEQICQNFATPAIGNTLNYTLSVNGSSSATVNFSITATGSFTLPGSAYNTICNAVNLGTLNSSSTIGNRSLSTYGNFCADNIGDPSPWGNNNDQGVWLQFTTSATPAAVIQIEAESDPQNLGNDIDLQLALYESSNGTCSGALTLLEDSYIGLGLLNDEDLSINCLQPNTTYFILVDGERTNLINTGGQEGYFGLQVVDAGVLQAADEICDAEFLGAVPAGGSVATPNLSRSNVCATNTNDPNPGAWSSDKTVWFRFQAPPTGHVIIEADSDPLLPLSNDPIDLQLAIYGTNNNACTGTLDFIASDYTPGLFGEELNVRCLTPGDNYWILVDGSPLNVDGIFDITVRDGGIPPAPNDLICDAIPLGAPGNGGTVGLNNQNNYCADNIFEPIPSNWGNDQGVWYTFIAPPSGKVEIRLDNGNVLTGDNIDLQVAVYDLTGAVCTGVPIELKSEHGGIGVLWDEDMEVECLQPGREYWILVDGEGSLIDPDLQEGTFDIEVFGDPRDLASPYDKPCNALALGDPTGTSIGTSPITTHGSQNNFCADAVGEPQPSGFTADQTVWYTFVAPSTGNVNIDLTSDDVLNGTDPINLQIAVWETPGCTGPWREEVSGDDLIYDVDLDVFCLTPGQVYYIQVDGSPPTILGGEEGYFDITISEIPSIPVAPNDSICNAIALGNPFAGTVGVTNQQNLCADDLGDPNPSAFGTDQTVWYSFTTPATGGPFAVNIDATSSLPWPLGNRDAVDLQLAVFGSSNNTCTGTLTEVESGYSLLDLFDERLNVACLEENKTYFVMVDGSFLDVQGYFDISISAAASVPIPTNDLICQHEDLGTVPIGGNINNGVNYYNFCADVEPGEPSPFGIEQTVWFSFVAPNHTGLNATSNVTISVESDPAGVGNTVDLQLAVYESSNNTCTGAMNLLEDGSDDPTFSFDAEVNVTCLYPGRRYWVQVDGSIINQEGYFQIEIEDDGAGFRPPYNFICTAEPLGVVPNGGNINNGVNYTNLCSDTEAGEPNPNAFSIDKTVWFTFTAPASGNVTIQAENDPNNIGDEIDLQLALYYSVNNTCSGPFLEVDSDHDLFNKDESLTVDCLEAGRLYFLQVDGSNGAFGDEDGWFTLEVIDDGGTSSFPYNNNICDAYNFGIPSAPQNLTNESNECANVELGEPGAGGYASHTVWYEFVAPPSGRVEIEVNSSNIFLGMDPEVRLFSSSNNTCTGNLSQIERSNLPTALIPENIEANCLISGNTYFIQVDGSNLVIEGQFDISIEAIFPNYGTGLAGDPEPSNNACDSAITLPVQTQSCLNGAGSFSNLNYGYPTITYNPAFAQGCGGNCGATWYQFTMPASGNAVIEGSDDNIGGGIIGDFSDLVVAAYSGSCNNLTPIDCDQGGLTSDVSFQVAAAPGTTIWLQVFNDDGEDEGEEYQLCISEGCGFDDCLNALAVPMLPNVPYCFNTAGASGEDVAGGSAGYFECSEGDNPENSVYYYFVSDCNGSDVTLSVINAVSNGNCILGITPTDGFNISLFQDATPCDNNPDTLVDCQTFTSCNVQPFNWNQTYTGLSPNTPYIIQIDGGFGNLGGDNVGEIMITTTTDPVVSPVSTPLSCSGLNDGTASAVTQGGVGPFTFLWSNNSTDSTAINLAAGTYFVTVTGSNGCFDTASVVVGNSTLLIATITNSSDASCGNSCDGQASVTALGGSVATTYTYLWSDPAAQTTATASNLCAGTYMVTVYDDNACFDTTSVIINEPTPVLLQVDSIQNIACNGVCNGQISLSASGGTVIGIYQYNWSTGATTAQISNLCAGSYSVTVSDDNGCTDTLTIDILQPSSVALTLTQQNNIACNGDSTGSIVVIANNGTPNYTYSLFTTMGLTSSNTTGSFGNLPAQAYGVLVQDASGCTDSIPVVLTEPLPLVLNLVSSSNISCFGATDGSITVQGSGGAAPYRYSSDGINFSSNNAFTNLTARAYSITIRDSFNCSTTLHLNLSEPAAIVLTNTNQTDASCGACDGTATVNASGGITPLTYLWTSGEVTAIATALCAGSNEVTVTDNNGCTATLAFNIGNASGFTATASVNQPISCFGTCDGAVSVNAPVGGGSFTTLWNTGATNDSLQNLCAGVYTATVTDASGCFVIQSINLMAPDSLTALAATLQDVSCVGNSDGQATVTINGGTLPYTILWDDNSATATNNSLAAGPHNVTITDANGCMATASTIIGSPTALAITLQNTTASNCGSTGCDGSATAVVSGGQAPYTYLWDNGNTNPTPNDLCPNFNGVTVTDANGCTISASVLIPANSSLNLALTGAVDPSCYLACTGNLTVAASGGNTTSPYTFQWDDPANQTTATANNLCAGTYRVTVTDRDGCSAAGAFTLSQPDSLTIDLTPIAASCAGVNNGSINSLVQGGTSPYNYQWSSGTTTATLSNVAAGTYNLTVTDANGCLATASAIVLDADSLLTTTTIASPYNGQQISCANGNDGQATITVTGGTAPYTYLWINGATTATVTGLQASTYPVTVTDANGCTAVDSVTLMHPDQIVINTQAISSYNGYNISCYDSNDGIVATTVTGGTGTYTYLWSDGQTGDTATSLNRGTYALTVTDINGCFTVVTDSLTGPDRLGDTIITLQAVSCFGGNDGAAMVLPTGGIAPYSYNWSTGSSNATANNLPTGWHTVTITDSNACFLIDSVYIQEPSSLVSSLSATTTNCATSADGSATATASGGTLPYQFLWSTMATSATINNVAAGTYSVTITDANTCTLVDSITVTSPTAIVAAAQQTQHVSCPGIADAGASASATGGTAPYTFLWSTGATNAIIQNIPAGTYQVTITDSKGCTDTASVVIVNPAALQLNAAADLIYNGQAISCAGAVDGQATVTVTGGTGPYTYLWPDGQTTATAIGLGAQQYWVSVTDANGCSDTAQVQLTAPIAISITANLTGAISCAGGNDGSALANALGGTRPYHYVWSTGDTTAATNSLTVGSHQVTVTDANGCFATTSVNLGEPNPIVLIGSSNNVSCFGGSDGTVNVFAQAGTIPYSYVWTGGQTTATATALTAGVYYVTVTDANGCSQIDSQIITQPTPIAISFSNIIDIDCVNNLTGSATATVTGGVGPYRYQWNGLPNASTTSTTLLYGWNELVVADANGCSQLDSVFINTPNPMITTAIALDAGCFGALDGEGAVTVSGGTPPYQFLWSTGATASAINNLGAGIYRVTVTDSIGCLTIETIVIDQNDPLQASFSQVTQSDCNNGTEGSITALVQGGVAPYLFDWSNGQQMTDSSTTTISNLAAGNYFLTLTDQDNCSTTLDTRILDPARLSATIKGSVLKCFGDTDGRVNVVASGGTPPYFYSLNGGSVQSSGNFTNLTAGLYNIVVSDAGGCFFNTSTTVAQGDSILLEVTADQSILYGETVQLFVRLPINAPTNPIITWTPTNGLSCTDCFQPVAQPSRSTLYTVSVTGDEGCVSSADIFVEVDNDNGVFVPDAFSPNGDRTNDVFMLYSSGAVEEIEEFMIFDRWGELVCQHKNVAPNYPAYGWDGTFLGTPMGMGVFVYYIKVRYFDGKTEILKGDVTLMR
ncbi:MAG: T9SS type B sorting domain-containing protein [Aureispira sp.]